ncbi:MULTISPECIES: hypothetical protein [Roseomonadaceae]|uniref:Uncharacterized protein n=1 Tax=Falsiroseomonas oleicola TaxID=2801474 RepID=A0ABS6H5N7_9PROT|nr:hypothetical protein [Roseomonas oleicola]MBU8543997.1 hypothetical protein [Roseomonas oleicola]
MQWWHNPRYVLPKPWRRVVDLWRYSQGGMGGAGWLPEAGGVASQAAWLLSAFQVLDAESARLEKLRTQKEP